MKKSRFTPEQVTMDLRHADEGTPVAEVFCKMGISEKTFYRWHIGAGRRSSRG